MLTDITGGHVRIWRTKTLKVLRNVDANMQLRPTRL